MNMKNTVGVRAYRAMFDITFILGLYRNYVTVPTSVVSKLIHLKE